MPDKCVSLSIGDDVRSFTGPANDSAWQPTPLENHNQFLPFFRRFPRIGVVDEPTGDALIDTVAHKVQAATIVTMVFDTVPIELAGLERAVMLHQVHDGKELMAIATGPAWAAFLPLFEVERVCSAARRADVKESNVPFCLKMPLHEHRPGLQSSRFATILRQKLRM